MKKVLLIGNGGREHALACKFAASEQVDVVYVARGNADTALEPKVFNVPIPPLATQELIQFAKTSHVDLTMVSPAVALAQGIVDAMSTADLCCLGPTQKAAQLESSKIYAKAFMDRYNIPTALHQTFHQNERDAAIDYVQAVGAPIVIKANGLAAGKDVFVAQTLEDAVAAIDGLFTHRQCGRAGDTLLIEEFLPGTQVNFHVLTDGKTILPLEPAKESEVLDDALNEHIMNRIIRPTIRGLQYEGYQYTGFMNVELMITKRGETKVLGYHCQLGEFQAQSILTRLQSDFYQCCMAAAGSHLHDITLEWDHDNHRQDIRLPC